MADEIAGKILESVYANPEDEGIMQKHKRIQAELAPGMHRFMALEKGTTMRDVLDLLALLMEELPGVGGETVEETKKGAKDALVKAYNRWMSGENAE
jgi:hypothetical protein